MSKYANGFYQLLNPEKYVGKNTPHYRSSWEHATMRMLDSNPGILKWASESIHINYKNPFTNKQTIYVPDFFVLYMDANNRQHAELWEVKPTKETTLEAAGRSKKAQAAAIPQQEVREPRPGDAAIWGGGFKNLNMKNILSGRAVQSVRGEQVGINPREAGNLTGPKAASYIADHENLSVGKT